MPFMSHLHYAVRQLDFDLKDIIFFEQFFRQALDSTLDIDRDSDQIQIHNF